MKRRSEEKQERLWVSPEALASSPGHPFYKQLNAILRKAQFDSFVEGICERFYASKGGRRSIPPGTYFRMLLIGYFERIGSERGICWRCADSLSLREFLGLALDESVPDHSTLSRIRSRFSLDVHEQVFDWVLGVLASSGLIDGKTIGIDATTLEADAALRSITRRDTGEEYTAFLEGLARENGIEDPSRSDLAKLDRKRSGKGSNKDWVNPNDPEAQIMKMKDGRTHLAHKAEHAVDMSGSGAVLAVTLHGGATGDTASLPKTLGEALDRLDRIRKNSESADSLHPQAGSEVVADKGYHSSATLKHLEDMNCRSYVSEPDRGRRNWKKDPEAKEATYANRRRIRGSRGKQLLRKRGEYLERPFEHYLGGGGMRRTRLRGHENILKRFLIHVAGMNIAVLMRDLFRAGTPKAFADALGALHRLIFGIIAQQVGAHTATTVWIETAQRYQRDHIVALLAFCLHDESAVGAYETQKSTGC